MGPVEEVCLLVWLVAPLPDADFEVDLRPTAKMFFFEDQARAVLDDTPPEFHLWRATLAITYELSDYELVD